jgi:L-amino acid N-acyltransferase YncA
VRIRAATADDAAAISAIYAPYVTGSIVSFETDPPDAATMRERIEAAGDLYPWLVAEQDGGVVAYAYASQFRAHPAYRYAVETSVYVASAAQGVGTGTALYRLLLDILARQGFAQAIAGITLPNPASVRLHEALGFDRAGVYRKVGYKHDAWHDVGLWQRSLGAATLPPVEPELVSSVYPR